MPKMLRHVKTGEIWPMNPNMARHPDVEVFDQPDKQFAAATAEDPEATLGDVMGAGSDEPTVTGDHEFEDVPDFEEPEANSDEVEAKKQAIAAEAKKKAAAKRKAATAKKRAAKKKAEAAAALAAETTDDDEELDDLDLDDFDE